MYLNDFYSPFVFTNKNTPIIINITPAKADLLNSVHKILNINIIMHHTLQ